MKYFLVKTDPDTYSVDDFEKEGETVWDGVHNYQAINFIKTMKPGDTVFIYHSMTDKEILALGTVSSEPYENTNDPRYSWAIKIKFDRRTNPLSLTTMKAEPFLKGFLLLVNPRLSVMPVPEPMANWILTKL